MKRKLLLAALCVVGALGFKAQAQDAGTYYIQNVGTGKWLGPGNSWGTQASVLNHADYWKLAKISDGVYTLESVVSNGGTSYYLSGTYCDAGATNFTFTAITGKENTYSIANANGGYLTTNGTTVDVSATNASVEAAQWKLWSEADMAAGMAAATIENPFDATYLIKDHDLGRNNRDYSAWSNTGATAPKTSKGTDGNDDGTAKTGNARYSIEAYHVAFDVNQTLSSVPNGVYAVRVNGFYRQDGNDANLPYVYANDSKTTLPARTGTENDMQAAAVSFEAGNYLSEPAYVQVENGTLKVGVATTGTSCWSIFKNFHLAYYGDVTLAEVLLAEYVSAYNTALAAAKAYQSADMFDEDKTALNIAISDNTIDLSGSVTEEQLTTATANLNAAATAAATAATQYATYTNANTLINGGSNVDLTSLIVNPSFESDFTGWTNSGMGKQTNTSFGKTGNTYVESWQPSGTKSLSQTIGVLPAGIYELSVKAKARGVTSAKVFAAGIEQAVKIADEENTYTVSFALDDKAEALIGFEGVGTGAGSSWLALDNFTLKYVGALPSELTAVTGKMNADVAAAQTTAVEAYNTTQNVANYNAAQAAIAAAQASVNAYTAAAAALTKANTTLISTNVYTADARSAFEEAINDAQNAYNENSMTDAVANGLENALNGGTKYKPENVPARDYIAGAWTASNGVSIYTNNWSTEGDNDESGFTTPFIEDWVNDNSKLADTEISATMGNLPNGLYSVSAQIRLVNTKTAEGDTGYDGLALQVNNGTAVAFADATPYADNTRFVKTITAEGLVKDGNLSIKLNVASTNASWLSFKNVNYTKVRDLTPEEMAVAPTAIALKNGEDVVTEVALDATTNTVTLTPSYTPEGATEGYLTWTSSDENVATVANGVVTGISSGTATITATSTLDATVSATATVTVTYPESTVPETVEIIDEEAATKTIYTLSQTNLFKNGTFGYPNALAGWKATNYSTDAVASNFTIETAGGAVDNGAYITTNGGGASSEKTLRKAIAVESGKTYYFAVYTNGKAPSASNFQYNALFKMSDATTENGTIKVFEWPQGAGQTATEWSKTEDVFTAETDFVGVRMGWNESTKFDEFVLAEVTNTEVIDLSATAEDYAALNEAIENAPVPGFLAGEAAPYANVEAVKALAAAKAIDQNVKNLAETVQAATVALTSVTWVMNTEEVNAVYDGTFANATNNGAPAGWRMSNNTLGGDYHSRAFVGDDRMAEFNQTKSGLFLRFDGTNSTRGSMYYYGDSDGYTMPLKANTTYYVKVDFAGWGSTDKPLRMNVTGPEGFTAVGQQVNTSVRADNADKTPQQFYIVFTTGATDGNYVINFQTPGADTNTHNVVISNVELYRLGATLAVKASKYGTFVAPFEVTIPDGVEAYEVESVTTDYVKLAPVSGTTLAARTPVILKNTTDALVEATFYGKSETEEDKEDGTYLVGVYKDGVTIPTGSYVLQTDGDTQAFYVVNGTFTSTANRCYLTNAVSGANIRSISLAGEATGIEAISALTSGNYDAIYTAGGVKVESLQKGLNIVVKDGKSHKIYVK